MSYNYTYNQYDFNADDYTPQELHALMHDIYDGTCKPEVIVHNHYDAAAELKAALDGEKIITPEGSRVKTIPITSFFEDADYEEPTKSVMRKSRKRW